MGDNAQTSVPKFTSGDVLTAANTNLLSNGIPVFSGTATRNDAFGGSGEKVLAEGQFAFLEDSNTTQFYDGAAWKPVGTVLQVVSAEYSTQATSTTQTYADSGLTLAITPSSTSSKVLVQITQSYGRDDGNSLNSVGLKLFRGATDLGVFATRAGFTNNAIYQSGTVAYNYLDSPATTSATTYKTQFNNALVAAANAYTQYVSAKSTITLMEIAG